MARSGKIAYDIEFNVKNENLKNIKQELNSLIGSLQKIQQNATQAKILGSLDKELEMAAKEAEKLSGVINSSWNVKLNQLNLTKFEQNIKNSYGSLEQLRVQLNKIGQGGTFNKLANEILGTNLQLKTTSSLLDKMSVTFANTIRYGISSRVFNNFASSISKAYDYVKDLDTSLNSIRKVSNASADDMARFAKYANQSAQAMGKSTLDYTKGALIYYQQGLGEEEVKKRTDITMKMSNVLGTSADEVSNYMTAIWNNFDDGSKSLEYFADVLTKLGATTASSAEEISTGLEKFSAISKTVGLSYEYAAAALATVTATTRQSAETVGTAFKTLFARIQGLNLGETLDDGTTLNKYSEALSKVGISIKDQSGNLKDMDKILDEMGAKWQTLDKDQQTALAQTVAGVRQYSQLMALMNNWDFFKENLSTANNATGELQRQQEIYLESMEAHLEKFRTETERTYAALFDEKSVSSLADVATKALSKINDVIEGLGGGLNSVINLAAQLAVVFHKQLGTSLLRTFDNLKLYWKENVQSIKFVEETIQRVQQQSAGEGFSSGTGMNTAYVQEQAETVAQALKYRKGLTEEQYNEIVNDAKDLALLKQKRDYLEQIKRISEEQNDVTTLSQAQKDYKSLQSAQKQASDVFKQLNKSITEIENSGSEDENQAHYDQIKQTVQDILNLKYQIAEVDDASFLTEVQKKDLTEIARRLEEDELLTDQDKQTLDEIALQSKTYYIAKLEEQKELMRAITEDEQKVTEETDLQIAALERKNAANINNGKRQYAASQGMQTFSATIQGLTAITGAISAFTDKNADGAQKANAAWQGVFGTGSAIANAILPGSGFIVQGIGSIGKSILEATGLWEGFEDLFKSSEEKLKEIREELEKIKKVESEALSTYDDKKKAEDYFKGIAERFEYLQSLAQKSLLTDELRSEYETYLDKVQKYNKDLVITYDAQCKKIAANSDIILKTIGLIQEENELLLKQTYTTDNWNEFTKNKEDEYKTLQKSYKNQTSTINDKYTRTNKLKFGNGGFSKYSDSQAALSMDREKLADLFDANSSVYRQGEGAGTKGIDRRFYGISEDDLKILKALIGGNNYSVNWGYETRQKFNNMSNEDIKKLWEKANKMFSQMPDAKKNGVTNLWKDLYTQVQNGVFDLDYDQKANELAYAKRSTIDSFSIDPGSVFHYLTNMSENKGTYDAYKELGLENADNLLLSYIEGMNDKIDQFVDGDNIDYDKIKDKVVNIQKNIYEALQSHPELIEQINNVNKFSDAGLSSEQYERELQKRIEEFLANIESEADFNKIKDILPTLFNVKSVGAQWKDGKAQLGANGGWDIVTKGEDRARKIANSLVDLEGFTSKTDKKELSKQIEQFLQNGLDDTTLSNLDSATFIDKFVLYLNQELEAAGKDGKINVEDVINRALKSMNVETGGLSAASKEKAKELGYTEQALEGYTKKLQKNNKVLKENQALTEKVALSQMDLANDLKNVISKWDTWEKDLEKVDKGTADYYKTLGEMADAIGDVFNVPISTDFVEKNLSKIKKMVDGDINAFEDLQKLASKDYVANLEINANTDRIKEVRTELNNFIDEYSGKNIGFTATMDDSNFVKALNKMMENGELTEKQVNDYLAGIGYEGEVGYKTGPTTESESQISGTILGKDFQIGKVKTKTTTQVPYLKSVTKTSDRRTRASTFKGSTTGSNARSGSKGGGGGSSSKPNQIDKIDDEADRYHKVNTQISKVENQLKKVQSQQQKLVGGKLIENLNKQWQLLNIQVQNYNEKLKIAKGEQDELAQTLVKQGVQFNADGTIANYMEAFQAQEDYVNGLIVQYNKLSKKQQETWDNNKTIDKAKENFNKFKEDMNRYDELIASEIPGLEQSIQDAIDKQIEINVEKFNLKLTVILDMNQATRDWNSWKKKVIDGIKEDDILGNARARLQDFATYFNKDNDGDIQARAEQVTKILTELKQMDSTGKSSVYGDDRQKALDELKEKYTDLMDSMNQELELEEELYQAILDEMDKVQEKFDEQIESYEFLRDMINHDIKVIQMVYGENAYSDLAKFYEKQQDNYEKQLDFQRQQKDFWYAEMQAAEEGSEQWNKAKENWMSAVQEFNKILEEGLDNAKNKFQNAINDIFQNLNNTITGGLGLDYVNEEWELINKNADRYLDTVNATYGIRALEKKYTDAINKSNNLNAQQKLKKIMDEQLDDLKQKDRLTQYDLDRANKLYDIELARLALEEAQMNKSQMRLRRDSQGNYTYQYVANDDKIAEAEQKIEDLYNQLYNFDKERYNQVLNDAYTAWNEYQQKMAEAAMINDPQERAERELLIQQEYDELMTQIEQDYQVARYTLQESLFTSLAILTADSLDNSTNAYGIALADAQGRTKIAFDDISNTINDAFAGADQISADTFERIAAAAEAAMSQVDGYTSNSFENIKAGFDELEPYEKNIIATQLIPTWDNGISDMVQHFIYGPNGGMQAIQDTFTGTISSMQTLFVGADGKSGFVGATKDGWDKIKKAENDYQIDLGKLEKVSGQTFTAIKNGANEAYNKITPLITKNDELIKKYGEELEQVKKVYDKVKELKEMFDKQATSAKNAAEEAYKYYTQQQKLNEKEIDNAPKTDTNSNLNSGGNSGGSSNDSGSGSGSNSGGGTSKGNGKAEVGDEVTVKSTATKWGSKSGSVTMWYKVPGNKFYIKAVSGSQAQIGDPHGPNYTDKGITGWANISDLTGYDTGGYTGSWNNSGRLAMLHQKELVLNAKDTENMLNTVAIMRGLTYSLGSTMLSRLAGATASGYNGSGSGSDGILEQNVHIDATFPNVKNATEIEEALNNLVNAASQRAYERR